MYNSRDQNTMKFRGRSGMPSREAIRSAQFEGAILRPSNGDIALLPERAVTRHALQHKNHDQCCGKLTE